MTRTHWCQTRAPNKRHFTEQAEILHEKRITTSFVSESCMLLGNLLYIKHLENMYTSFEIPKKVVDNV